MECALSLESRFRSCTMTAQSSPTPIYIWMLRKDKKAWRRTDVLEVWNGLTSKPPGKNLKHEMQASDWQELFREHSKPGSALQAVSLLEKDRACFILRQREKPGMHLIWRVVGRTPHIKSYSPITTTQMGSIYDMLVWSLEAENSKSPPSLVVLPWPHGF